MNQQSILLPVLVYVVSYLYTLPGHATVDNNWALEKSSEGISVYVMPVTGSDIIKVKTHVLIEAPLPRIQQILDDVEHRNNWVPFLQRSSILQSIDANERLEYSLFAAPWPASDRDFTYRMTRLQNSPEQLVYAMTSEVIESMPEQAGVVRAELVESRYSLISLGPQLTELELVFHADPKGWLPNWIINIIQRVLPYKILANLRELATTSSAQKNRGTTLR